MRKVKVVITISDLEFGGAQRQVVELANNINRDEFDLFIVSLSDYVPLASFLKFPEQLKIIPRTKRFDLHVVLKLARFLKKVKADIVHSFLFDATIASRLAGKLAGCVVVGSERNTDYSFKKIELAAYFLTRVCNDYTIANSWAGARFNSKKLKQPIEKYRVVYNGVDIQRFKPADPDKVRQLRQSLGIPNNKKVVGMFGSFKPQKNHVLFIKAVSRIKDKFKDVVFLFIGDVLYKGMSNSLETKQKIEKLVKKLKLQKDCLFIGNKENVEDYYSICTLTVLPSLFEGTPNVVLESMACGVPVIVTDVSDNSFIVADGEVGFVVPLNQEWTLAERIIQILKDNTLREKFSHNARERAVKEFSTHSMAQNVAKVYKELTLVKNKRVKYETWS